MEAKDLSRFWWSIKKLPQENTRISFFRCGFKCAVHHGRFLQFVQQVNVVASSTSAVYLLLLLQSRRGRGWLGRRTQTCVTRPVVQHRWSNGIRVICHLSLGGYRGPAHLLSYWQRARANALDDTASIPAARTRPCQILSDKYHTTLCTPVAMLPPSTEPCSNTTTTTTTAAASVLQSTLPLARRSVS